MADSRVIITEGSGQSIDTRTESTNSQHRQVVVLGDPSVNDDVAVVRGADPASNDVGVVVREPNTTTIVSLMNSSGIRIRDISDGSIVVRSITASIAAHILSTNGTLAVRAGDGTFAVYFSPNEPTVLASGRQGTTTRPLIMNTEGAVKVYDLVNGTISTVAAVTDITNSIKIHILSTNGTMAVNVGKTDGTIYVGFSPSRPVVLADNLHTAGIFTVSGSTAGVSDSGVQLVAPSANYSFKVFAFSLTTTAQAHMVARFTNGGGSATEYWRVGLQAPSAGIAGANLAVTPPGYLFATGTSTTLALHKDTASLIHYSVSYIKESA